MTKGEPERVTGGRVYLVSSEDLEALGQSFEGRLHDLLTLANVSARWSIGEDRVFFRVAFLMPPEKTETVQIVLHVGPGDSGEPVLTLCLLEDL